MQYTVNLVLGGILYFAIIRCLIASGAPRLPALEIHYHPSHPLVLLWLAHFHKILDCRCANSKSSISVLHKINHPRRFWGACFRDTLLCLASLLSGSPRTSLVGLLNGITCAKNVSVNLLIVHNVCSHFIVAHATTNE